MDNQPRFAKAHSKLVALEYQRLGWTVVREFFSTASEEPYEYVLEWKKAEPPVYIDWEEWRRRISHYT